MTSLYLGVDGGGTKTQCAICDEAGQVLGSGLAGASGIDSVGAQVATVSIAAAVTQARQQAGVGDQSFAGVFFGMAGVVSADDRAIIRAIAQELQLGPHVGVDHDIRISLAGGLSGRPGIALIAGTGSSCFGRNAQGERWQAGGWGHLISDEGSSYWLGWHAIRLAAGTADGRWHSTLLAPVLAQLGIAHINDIHYRLYTTGIGKAEVAAFAPLVFQAAAGGDSQASQLIEQAAQELAQMVRAVAHHLGWATTPCEVTLTGGLWHAGAAIIDPFRGALARELPQARIVMPELPPVLGACVLAIQEGAGIVDATLLSTLQRNAPAL